MVPDHGCKAPVTNEEVQNVFILSTLHDEVAYGHDAIVSLPNPLSPKEKPARHNSHGCRLLRLCGSADPLRVTNYSKGGWASPPAEFLIKI